jgi:hypothetical protein
METEISKLSNDCVEALLDYDKLLNKVYHVDSTLFNIKTKEYESLYKNFIEVHYSEFISQFGNKERFDKLHYYIHEKYKSFELLFKQIKACRFERELNKLELEINDFKGILKKRGTEFEVEYLRKLDFNIDNAPDRNLDKAKVIYAEAKNILTPVSDIEISIKPFKASNYYDSFANPSDDSYEKDYEELHDKYKNIINLLAKACNKTNEAIRLLE